MLSPTNVNDVQPSQPNSQASDPESSPFRAARQSVATALTFGFDVMTKPLDMITERASRYYENASTPSVLIDVGGCLVGAAAANSAYDEESSTTQTALATTGVVLAGLGSYLSNHKANASVQPLRNIASNTINTVSAAKGFIVNKADEMVSAVTARVNNGLAAAGIERLVIVDDIIDFMIAYSTPAPSADETSTDTSSADTSNADTSNADTSNADTSNADASPSKDNISGKVRSSHVFSPQSTKTKSLKKLKKAAKLPYIQATKQLESIREDEDNS